MSEKLVKVKILKHVGAFVPDQIVEVSEEFAKHLCHVNELTDGITTTRHVRAVMLSEVAGLEAAANSIENLTASEAKELGLKNVVGPAQVEKKSEEPSEEEISKAEAELAKQAEAELANEEKSNKGKGKK